MSNKSQIVFPQYWTDENGVQYSRARANAPWVPVPGQVLLSSQASDTPAGFPGLGLNSHYPADQHGRQPLAPSNFPGTSANNNMSLGTNFDLGPTQHLLPPSHLSIDPMSIPLPDDDDDDFSPTQKVLEQAAPPLSKAASSRRRPLSEKAKGKQRALDPSVASGSGLKRKASTPLPAVSMASKKTKGRGAGVSNYSSDDVDALFDILEELLPLGGHAWNSAADEFNAWAVENGRPTRTTKSLELKYKQLVKTSKPTGDAECPPNVLRAHLIDDLMNDKAGSQDLDDEDIIDADEDVVELSETEDKKPEKPEKQDKKAVVKVEKSEGPIARRPPADRISHPRASRNASQDLLNTISTAMDPEARRARNEEHSLAAMQSTQIFQLTSQLRETQRQLESLRTQVMESERRCNTAERRADRAELLGMMGTTASNHHRSASSPVHPRRYDPYPPASQPRLRPRPRQPRYRQDIYYGDGGHSVRWVGGSDDDNEDHLNNDSPGTRRYTSTVPVHNWGMRTPSHRSPSPYTHPLTHPRSPSLEIRPPSPFRSAASGLNNILDPSTSLSCPSSSLTSFSMDNRDSFGVHVTPQAGPSSGISVLASPVDEDRGRIANSFEGTQGDKKPEDINQNRHA